MAIGVQPTKADLDALMGNVARAIKTALEKSSDLKFWLEAKPDAELTALGYTSQEVSTFKSAFTDADKLSQIFRGVQTQGTTYDFRSFLKLVWGTGGLIQNE